MRDRRRPPDGTWKLVADRTEDAGRGRSGRGGFLLALQGGAEIVVEMDRDFSHPPEFVPRLVDRLDAVGAPG